MPYNFIFNYFYRAVDIHKYRPPKFSASLLVGLFLMSHLLFLMSLFEILTGIQIHIIKKPHTYNDLAPFLLVFFIIVNLFYTKRRVEKILLTYSEKPITPINTILIFLLFLVPMVLFGILNAHVVAKKIIYIF